jgi:CRP/FNR family cyclic AMP-dependent transcriptional regulator
VIRDEEAGCAVKIEKGTFEKSVRFFDQGAVIFKENDEGNEMFIIIQGLVEIRKSTGPASSKILTTLQKGDMFGEMAIIEKQPRSATAVATQPTRVLVLNEKLYDTMIGTNPDFARKMNKVLSERIRRADAIIQNIMTTNRQNQLWSGLVQYAKEKGVATFKGSRVIITEFTHWAVQHLGMTDKDVQAILAQLLKREVIAFSARGKDEIIIEPREGAVLPEA